VSFVGNLAYADKLCCSVVPQVLYSDRVAPQDAVTVIALAALHYKLISPCGIRINTAKGLVDFQRSTTRAAITVIASCGATRSLL
jgi:hypothetical protein